MWKEKLILGLVSMAALTLAAPMTGSLEMIWRAVPFFASVVFLAVVGYSASAYGGAGSIVGIFVLALPLFVAIPMVDMPLLGGVAEGPVSQASRAWWATGFRLTDATLRTDLKVSQFMTTPRSKSRGGGGGRAVTYTVAPVVPAGWTPSDPVHFWVVGQSGMNAQPDWSQPSTSGVRLNQDDLRDQAIEAIAQKTGLVSADTRILLRGTPDPEKELRSAWLLLGLIIGIAAIAWTLTVVACRSRA